ncbi:hypothetical protein [Paucibacter soli]|uniref:hypothetical protein n=1 Tax=Paucibacter soli TaxID=3133433 RepID=UPI0030A35A8D
MSNQQHFATEAARKLSGFTYTNLSSSGAGVDACELWRCQKPGTTNDAFDICVTHRGLAVFGDIDGLLFQAGFTMKHLAGDDVAYMHGKLEAQCKEKEFDPNAFQGLVLSFSETAIEDAGLIPPRHPEEQSFAALHAGEKRGRRISSSELFAWWRQHGLKTVDTSEAKLSQMKVLDGVRELLDQASSVSSVEEACGFLDVCASEPDSLVPKDWSSDVNFHRPCRHLVARLHMVNQAAKAIQALLNEDRADISASAASTARGARP